ncbi:hypothetical protein Agub_g14634 [Astrephomene gubernaculifera]|uniref:Heme-binding protein 2 n=1 Tax=Astrephomene gubernaculifera TaxID=47775 RepID=A0AAD3E1S8_9CHLO|nr:hypothetical protein Agub_g14634 [Astrephomene gubernaculifera]
MSGGLCVLAALLALGCTPQLGLAERAEKTPWFCHDLDCPPFKVVKSYNEDVELRSYKAGMWVSTNVTGTQYDTAVSTGFKRLFAYISGANAAQQEINMTAPVRVQVTPGQGPFCEDHFKISFYVPYKLQDNPPAPLSAEVFADPAPAADFYVLSYGGRTDERKLLDKATELTDFLNKQKLPYDYSRFYSAGYDSPYRAHDRHNEIWIATK